METNKIIRVCGSVIKEESVVPLTTNILENTTVAEADFPYSAYYSSHPSIPRPNSLFLFTRYHYTLEEVLRFTKGMAPDLVKSTDVAAAVLDFKHYQYPAIRIKNFPDYKRLPLLQQSLVAKGAEFARTVQMADLAVVRTNKCFVLKEMDKGIYMDMVEKDKGYVTVNYLLSDEEFKTMISEIRNNSNCRLFDAAKCGIILEAEINEVIRIYSEKLDLELLKCLQSQFNKLMKVIKNAG